MPLETATVALRPRNPWEATDLGVAMARRWAGPVYGAWFMVALPLFVLLHLLCWGHWWLIPWLLWWLKPVLDRAPLHLLSDALLGDPPERRPLRRALPRLLFRQSIAALTWRRLDPARSFTLPVAQLEGLSGKTRRQRLRDLGQPGRGPAVWLTIVCANLEIALDFALLALVWLLIPDFVALEFSDLIDDSSAWGQLWLNAIGFCGMSLVEPCYVAAGFALYLNRRTWLEAWDLEPGLRRLAARLTPAGRTAAGLAILTVGLGLLAVPADGFATPQPNPPRPAEPAASIHPLCDQRRIREAELAQSSSPAKQALAETLREPELQVCELQQHWRFRKDEPLAPPPEQSPRPDWLAEWFAAMVETLLWFSVGLFIALAGWWALRKAPRTLARVRRRSARRSPPPDQGRYEALSPPAADLADEAWRLWDAGQWREALRMLYRGSLAGLATHYRLPTPASATEDECLRLATIHLADPELLDFFRRLTGNWQTAAYAHRPPETATAQALCAEWARYFAIGRESPG